MSLLNTSNLNVMFYQSQLVIFFPYLFLLVNQDRHPHHSHSPPGQQHVVRIYKVLIFKIKRTSEFIRMKDLFFLFSSQIWFDMKLASKEDRETHQLIQPTGSSSGQTQIPEWLNTRTDLVTFKIWLLVMFPRICYLHWGLCGTKMISSYQWIQ